MIQTTRVFFLALLFFSFYLLHPALSSSACDPAYEKLRSVTNLDKQTARNQIYTNLSTDSNINDACGLNATCCSSTAETHFKSNIAETIQLKLFNSLNTTIKPCTQSNLQDVTAEYILRSKNNLVAGFKIFAPQFAGSEDIFDQFFNYVKNGVLNIDLCNLEAEFQEVVFTVYTTTFVKAMAQRFLSVPSSNSFTQCFYNYFKKEEATFLNTEYKRFKERYNLFLRYLLALKTANEVLKDVISHTLSSDCKDALLKLTHCSLCAGNADTILSCPGYCNNVLHGCLVDLKEFGDAYTEFFGALKSAREQLSSYDPFHAFSIFQTKMFNFVTTVGGNTDTIKTAMENDCGATFTSTLGRRRRSRHVVKRQTTTAANAALQETVTCANSVSTLFGQLADSLCTGSVASTTCNCWNGATTGSYHYSVVNGDRLSQKANPELYLRSNTGLQYKDSIAKLKNITQNLKSCSSNVVNCPVKFCNLTVPRASDYNLGTRYHTFTQSGFPTPTPINVNCTVIKVSTTSVVWSKSTITIPATTSSTTSTTSSTSKSSHRASSTKIIMSSTRIIPSSTVHITTSPSIKQTTVRPQSSQNAPIGVDLIPDVDKDKNTSGVSPTCVTINLVILLVLLSLLL